MLAVKQPSPVSGDGGTALPHPSACGAPPTVSIDIPADEIAALSQRARNRRETWLAIHRSATELVQQRGLAETSVDAIAEGAGVSRRTLFNYFATKEDAVLGLVAPHCPPAALERFRDAAAPGGDEFQRTIRLLVDILRATFPRVPNAVPRRVLVGVHPDLFDRFQHVIRQAQVVAEEVLAERLDEIESTRALPASIARADAMQALLTIAGGVMKLAAKRHADAPFDVDETSLGEAIAVYRFVVKETL